MINLIPYILTMYMYQCIVCPETESVPITICIAVFMCMHWITNVEIAKLAPSRNASCSDDYLSCNYCLQLHGPAIISVRQVYYSRASTEILLTCICGKDT